MYAEIKNYKITIPVFEKVKCSLLSVTKIDSYRFNGNTFTSDLDYLNKNTMGDVI